MPSSPDRVPCPPAAPRADDAREAAAERLLLYLRLFPMPMERRLELALDVLRKLPERATPAEAVALARTRLDKPEAGRIPSACRPLRRGRMPSQYLGRPRTEAQALARTASRRSVVLLLTFVAALLALPLLLYTAAH